MEKASIQILDFKDLYTMRRQAFSKNLSTHHVSVAANSYSSDTSIRESDHVMLNEIATFIDTQNNKDKKIHYCL